MKPRIIFVHGNGAMSWRFAWTPWFKTELERLGYPTYFETMPDSIIARSKFWLQYLGAYAQVGKDDVLVGWSSGAVAAMRYAETNTLKGLVLVSPSYTDLGDDLEKQSGYFDTPWDWQSIKANTHDISLFYGTDDPFIPQAEFEVIATQLQPDLHPVAGAKHFIEYSTFPQLIDYVKNTY